MHNTIPVYRTIKTAWLYCYVSSMQPLPCKLLFQQHSLIPMEYKNILQCILLFQQHSLILMEYKNILQCILLFQYIEQWKKHSLILMEYKQTMLECILLFQYTRKRKQHSLMLRGINKPWYMYTTYYYSSISEVGDIIINTLCKLIS